MARLAWNPIAAPDFGTALEAIRGFSNSLGSAFSGLKDGVKEFDQTTTDQVNKALMLRLAQTQDPNAARDFAKTLSAEEARRASAGTLASINSRPTELLQQAAQFRSNDRAVAMDSASPQMQEMLSRAFAGDEAGAQKIFEANRPAFAKIGYENYAGLIKDAQGAIGSNVRTAGDRIQNRAGEQNIFQSGERFNWDKVDRTDRLLAEDIAGSMNELTRDDAWAKLQGMPQVPGRVKSMVMQRLGLSPFTELDAYAQPSMGGVPAVGAGGGGGGDFTFAAPQQAVAQTLKGGGLSDAVVAGFLGNFHVEGGYNGARGDGGSASGIAQWRLDRRNNFKKMFGKDPHQASPEEQAKFVLWEVNNPKAAGLNPSKIAAIKAAKTPQEAAALIDESYEISSGEHRGRRVSAAAQAAAAIQGFLDRKQTDTDRRAADMETNYGNSLPEKFPALAQSRETPRQVAARLAKANAGVDAVWLEQAITKHMANAKTAGGSRHVVNAAMVGEAIMDSTGAQAANESWFGRLIPDVMARNTVGSDLVYDPDRTDAALKAYATGGMDDTIRANAKRAVATGTYEQGAALVQQAQARIAAKQAAAAARGVRNPNLGPEMLMLEQGRSMMGLGGELEQSDGNLLPGRPERPKVIQQNRPVRTPAPAAPARRNYPAPNDHSSAAARARVGSAANSAVGGVGEILAKWNPAALLLRAAIGE